MASVVPIQDSEFKSKVLDSTTPVLVDFWASWCGPCKAIAPILDELAAEYQGKVSIYKVNIDENATTTTQFKIKGVPTLLLFKGGEVVDQIVGALPKEQIRQVLEKSL